MSSLLAHVSIAEETLVTATLVEDEGEVVVAQRIGFLERKWKFVTCFLLVTFAVTTGVLIYEFYGNEGGELPAFIPSMQPSSIPSFLPSFNPMPTLKIVQARGHIRCGLRNSMVESGEGDLLDLVSFSPMFYCVLYVLQNQTYETVCVIWVY